MKLTNEDLRRIILEEVEKVLNEFHPAVDEKNEEFGEEDPLNPDPAQPQDVVRKIKSLGATLSKEKVDPKQLSFFNQKLEDAVNDLGDDDLSKERALAQAAEQVKKRFEKK
jgi:hypothetical protein